MLTIHDDDQWVQQAMADDTIVADYLLRLRHHQPNLRRHLSHCSLRQRRPVHGYVGPTASYEASHQSDTDSLSSSTRKRASDQSETAFARSSKKTRNVNESNTVGVEKIPKKRLSELVQEVKMRQTENDHLKNELETMKRKLEKESATNEMLKKRKLVLTSEMPVLKMQTILGPPQNVEVDHCVATDMASSETVLKDKGQEDTTLVCAATESVPLNLQEINGKEPSPLPDLNITPEEFFTDFVLD